ncbi:YutD family protein [Lactobacillus sp. ESL0679]|uniref:YutD family protein n=1 Tax=Lactobacillus sp. ESL0679 TaxID=2983209 RepID=UPI0023F74601|nr:YutD family protein [Lactobacillus sp. ESL0679]MDF7683630.1 YutD family protein [Lactobacillus sp. ESL0679]
MTDRTVADKADSSKRPERNNKFTEDQPLRHPLAVVGQVSDQVKINKQVYQILVNKREALDIEVLRQKYDPYLDQYDFLVGDVSSEHLRLKGFYKDNMRTAIDRKEQTIADYLMEYCNPGTGYFILQLLSPVHHYHSSSQKNWHGNYRQSGHRRFAAHSKKTVVFKKRRVHKTTFKKKETVAVKKGHSNHHSFVIKKRRGSK